MEQNEVPIFPRFRNDKRLGGRRLEGRLGHQFHSEPSDGACYSSFSAGVYSYEPYGVVKIVFGKSSLLILI